jgi:dipeptidyl aminopeptidase/acylaminoacyl peptidase
VCNRSHTYTPLSDKLLVAAANFNGTGRLVGINLETGDWAQIAEEEEVIELVFDRVIGLSATSVLGIFAGTKRTSTVRIFDVADASRNRIVRNSIRYDFPESFISFPEALAFPAQGEPKRTVHGFLWMPRNPEYTAEEGVLPPLVVYTHGGPTGTFSAGLNPRVQYLTSRGYAVFYLNYHGSTAHGRAHRDALWGRWGLLDADDTAEAARHLVASGRVRPGAVGCTGLSAGGYNTLMTVARHPDAFAGAVDVSGICDVASWRTATHKLEWFYADRLVMDKTAATPDDMAARYRERSALPRVDAVTTPLLIIHGKLDTVVALNQATDMADALEERGRDVRLVKVDNDGHMLAKPPSMRIWLDEEEKWWRKTLIGV